MKQHGSRWFATLPQECQGHEISAGFILAVTSLDYAAERCSLPPVNESKLNDTVLRNLPRYSEPVRPYLHQINTAEDGDFLRGEKLCACAACEVLAELLALKRFNSVKSSRLISRRQDSVCQSDRRSEPHRRTF
jgi:hypothetical protein